ncbi:MAG: transglycosylase SLT domain-containing protein [bacterium]|nr:transglycosylase SLT domain-containing protein [bacterium]
MKFSQLPTDDKIKQILGVLFLIIVGYFLLKVFVLSPAPNALSYNNTNFEVLGLNIPSNLDFCGEKIPANDFEIKGDLEKEFFNNSYWKNNSLQLFNKARRWFPYIEPILKAEGVPDDFKYLAVIESHLSNVSSPAGAAGFWQLVPNTAAYHGLEVNGEVDERFDVEKSTYAACGIIKQAYKEFHNWTLTAAAYNRGIGGILKAMKQQKAENYYDLLLNSETGSFVYRILAYKTLFSSPGHFGIKKKKWSYFPKVKYTTFKIDSSITTLSAFAAHIGTSPGTIKLYNPWLLKDALRNPAKKTYEIRIPKGPGDYSDYARDLMTEGGTLIQFAKDPQGVATMSPDSIDLLSTTSIIHVVKVEEPLLNLANFFKVKESDLRKWNNLPPGDNAVKGQTLIIHYKKEEK